MARVGSPDWQPEIELFFDGIESRTVFADVRDLLADWRDSARADAGLPGLERFEHHLAGECGANIMVLRHEDGDFRYESVGLQVAVLSGLDVAGMWLSDLNFPGSRIYLPRYKYCLEIRAPVFTIQRKISFGIPGSSERLLLPVRHPDGGLAIVAYLRSRADNHDLIRAVFNTSQHAILVASAVRDDAGEAVDFQLTAVNDAGAALFREEQGALVGKRMSDLLPPADIGTLWPNLVASLETGETRVVEPLRISTGSGGIYRISSARVGDGLAITVSDLTQLQEALKTLETQHDSLVKVNAELRSEIARRRRLEAELKQLAATDPLTGIANRRSFTETMNAGLAAARGPVGLILFDVDDFKAINDRYGHPAGDTVLQEIAAIVSRRFGADAVFGRVGGEEFGVFLLDRGEDDVCRIAEDLRRGVSEAVFEVAGDRIGVTASFGVKALGEPCEGHVLMAQADEALYLAKRAGRNRVECHCAGQSRALGVERTA